MLSRFILFSLCLPLLFSSNCPAGDALEFIKMLDNDIKQSQSPQAKSQLHIYRARQYSKIKEFEKALEDYNDALELNHQGWIHLERSKFLLAIGKYELAYEDAEAAKDEVPTLGREADKIMNAAAEEVRKIYEAENPITIVMDTKVDPYRKTRFDLMREQGVFAVKTASTRSSSKRKKTTKKQTAAACAPKKSRG